MHAATLLGGHTLSPGPQVRVVTGAALHAAWTATEPLQLGRDTEPRLGGI